MRTVSGLRVRVNVRVEVFDQATGRRARAWHAHNLTVDVGLNLLRDLLYGDPPDPITACAVGTSGAAPAAGQTALLAEVFRGVLAQRTKSAKTLTIRFALSSQQANGVTIREAGLFTTGGIMFARVTPEEYAKTVAQSVLYTWTISLEASD